MIVVDPIRLCQQNKGWPVDELCPNELPALASFISCTLPRPVLGSLVGAFSAMLVDYRITT